MDSEEQPSTKGFSGDRRFNRRDFLKTAGVGAAALGAGGGLGGVLAACGSSSPSSDSSGGGGRAIKIGFVSRDRRTGRVR